MLRVAYSNMKIFNSLPSDIYRNFKMINQILRVHYEGIILLLALFNLFNILSLPAKMSAINPNMF